MTIPPFVVEYFLLCKSRRDAIERYTQDGGIVTDVWLGFAKNTAACLGGASRPEQRRERRRSRFRAPSRDYSISHDLGGEFWHT